MCTETCLGDNCCLELSSSKKRKKEKMVTKTVLRKSVTSALLGPHVNDPWWNNESLPLWVNKQPYQSGCRAEQRGSAPCCVIGKLSHVSDVGWVVCWLLAASGEKEIAFKSLNTYYKAVTAGSADSWFLCGGVMLRDTEHAKAVVTKVRGGQTYLWFCSCGPPAASADQLLISGLICCAEFMGSAWNLRYKAVDLLRRGWFLQKMKIPDGDLTQMNVWLLGSCTTL